MGNYLVESMLSYGGRLDEGCGKKKKNLKEFYESDEPGYESDELGYYESDESLTEARNPENDEVNNIIKKI